MKKLKCIMLVDDNSNDNFFHERVIKKSNAAEHVVVKQTAKSALEYLRSNALRPNLILLDVNMPGMNGWEFLDAYEKLDASLKSSVIVVFLTTSENPDDQAKAIEMNADFITKPLTSDTLERLMSRYSNL